MGRISDSQREDILSRVDLVNIIDRHVPLKKAGKNYQACCPFHDEKTPSFSVNPAKQFYYCFGCGAAGDAVNFLMEYSRMDFREAIDVLAKEAGVTIEPDENYVPPTPAQKAMPDALRFAQSFYSANLRKPEYAAFVDYLKGRGLSGETAQRFGLGAVGSGSALVGAAPAALQASLEEVGLANRNNDGNYLRDFFYNRLMFPIRNEKGRIVGFGGRVLDDSKPKYINSPESSVFDKSKVLYGLFEAAEANDKLERLIVVEGYMDVVALDEHWVSNAVAAMGANFGEHNAKLAYRYVDELVFCFDGDAAGEKAAKKAIEAVAPYLLTGKAARFVFMPEGEDPDSFCAANGVDAFNDLVAAALEIDAAVVHLAKLGIDESKLESVAGKTKLLANAQALLALFDDSPIKALLKKAVAKAVGLTLKQLDLPRAPSKPGSKKTGGEGEPLSEPFMKRYALIEGSTAVYDEHANNVLKRTEFVAQVGKARAALWFDADDKLRISEAEAWGFDVENPLERYVYLYPTEEVWDVKKRQTVPVKNLKIALADRFNWWMYSRERQQIDHDCLVFDPEHKIDEKEGYINKFSGLEMQPSVRTDYEEGCKAIINLVCHLCNNDMAAVDWVMRWMAYPLQNVGAKMDSSLLFHGEVEGSGKTLLFSKILGRIYGRYFGEFGQAQLDSSWNSWQGERLFGVFDEVVSRKDKYSGIGRLKQMVTSEKVVIERKFRESQIESNYMNTVFLANDDLPFPISPFDRRWFVMWPKATLPADAQLAIDAELKADGIECFYQYLLNYSLNGFGLRDKPPVNADKQRLIEFGMAGWEIFYREWSNGELDAPYRTCLVMDLYTVYLAWCSEAHFKGMNRNNFVLNIKKRVEGHAKWRYRPGGANGSTNLKQRPFFIVSNPKKPEWNISDSQTIEDYATSSAFEFQWAAGLGTYQQSEAAAA